MIYSLSTIYNILMQLSTQDLLFVNMEMKMSTEYCLSNLW